MSRERDKYIDRIGDGISNTINKETKKAGYDKTYEGHIELVLFNKDTPKSEYLYGKYNIRYNNCSATFKIDDGIIHAIGDKVKVYIPSDDLKQKYAEIVTKVGLTKIVLKDLVESSNDGDIKKKEITFKYTDALGQEQDIIYNMIKSERTIVVNGTSVTIDSISEIDKPDGDVIAIEYK